MNANMNWTLTEENVTKIIDRLEKVGRTVDKKQAWMTFDRVFKNKVFEVGCLSELCEIYICRIWNYGIVK